MKLGTARIGQRTVAVRVDGQRAVELGFPDLGDLLRPPEWRTVAATATGHELHLNEVVFAPPVLKPEKTICVGLNYRTHIEEMGRPFPEFPTLFAKFHRALIGAADEIRLPHESIQVDWEAELGLIIGSEIRRANVADAADAIAGYTVVNDISARDWPHRTPQWLQGKTFEASTPCGPYMVTSDELGDDGLALSCRVDGDDVQSASTADLLFGPAELVAYISTVITLVPGDIIATGTPGGVGLGRAPPRFLRDGSLVETVIAGVGELRNRCEAESPRA